MRNTKILIIALFCSFITLSFALTNSQLNDDKTLAMQRFENSTFSFETSNNATIGDLHVYGDNGMIYQSGPWISGKIPRRDDLGRKLYWLQYPPTSSQQTMVHSDDPDWNESLVMVVDTLTTVAFDGDLDLYELLPAYNPRIISNPDVSHLFGEYNELDTTLESIAGLPSPLPYDPFNSDTFCFSIPQAEAFDAPGFITYSSYYYDYCPFGTTSMRHWGNATNRNRHYPLGLAVHQETFYSALLDYEWLMVNKYSIYNMNQEDTIEDITFAQYMDADIGLTDWGNEKARDDVSGYVSGEGYEFSYSRDKDHDGGLSPYYIGVKTFIDDHEIKHTSWHWKVGDGPDDFKPRNIVTGNATTNEKYWLTAGKNPNYTKYTQLRLGDDYLEYEQPMPNDTRFLHSAFGSQPGDPDYDETDAQGNYTKRINLAPGECLTVYAVYFIGLSLQDMKTKALQIEDMRLNDFQISNIDGLLSYPYLRNPSKLPPDSFSLSWASATMPDHYELAWREYETPAKTWNSIELDAETNDYLLGGLDPVKWYEIKVAAVYYNPEEVNVDSQIRLACLNYVSVEDENLMPLPQISSYPNPFVDRATIEYELKEAGETKIEIYNLKGQLVKEISSGHQRIGQHQVTWDGKNNRGERCSDGVYLLRINDGRNTHTKKIVKLK